MSFVRPDQFASALGISDRAARHAFAKAHGGKPWRGHRLPVQQLEGQRGGAGGKSLVILPDLCSPELRDLLGLSETTPETALKAPVRHPVEAEHIAIARDKQWIIAPALAHPPRSSERARVIEELAAMPFHKVGAEYAPVAKRTLYDWIAAAETNVAKLIPKARSDKGQRRVLISRAWDRDCGLPEGEMIRIADALERKARGYLSKGRSVRNVEKICSHILRELTEDAGVSLPRADLEKLCKISAKYVNRFREMKAVHAFEADNKTYTDKHEFHVKRGLTERPMEVLMGDVHTVDLTISEALSSKHIGYRELALKAALEGKVKVKAWLIAWMDCSSGYIWATPVITGPGQGITQQDVALSLYDVLTCPYGGMPETFVLDHGSEYEFLIEAVTRFAAMADMAGPSLVKCRPYHPEGKARLEGAFGRIEKQFVNALPGYNGGSFLNPRLQSRGKLVAPYDRGPERLIEDLHTAVAQYNGTAQGRDSDLKGLSPKAMLEAKAAVTSWQAQRIDPEDDKMFDLVFSREVRRDVHQGGVKIGNRMYAADILAEMIGEKQVSILVPHRDPDGPVILRRGENTYWLTSDVYGITDPNGAKRKSAMVGLQRAEIERRKATADTDVDVQQTLSDMADMSPVQHNAPDNWTIGGLDKGGFLTAPISEEEWREQQEAEARDIADEYLAFKKANEREASGGNR
ncbi:transposase family protein [Marivita sp. S6314]|uniref:integrase catalytic domain-containing protein n=1 Tax=Marivita sp. S6314 TaxID=2926406 RepID=UPI001FF536D2|nr:transposase family protein [Marivita sp. S6314]MCK0150431.1 transposase family protein [Marivita sp. S6314]